MKKTLFLTAVALFTAFPNAYAVQCYGNSNYPGCQYVPETIPTPAPGSPPILQRAVIPLPPVVPKPLQNKILRPDISAFNNATVATNNLLPNGILFKVTAADCNNSMVNEDIASIKATLIAGREIGSFTDTTVATVNKTGLLDRVSITAGAGSWQEIVRTYNNRILTGTPIPPAVTAAYVNFLAAVKTLVNSTSCLEYMGPTSYQTETLSSQGLVDVGALTKNLRLASFSSIVNSLRADPNYKAFVSTVATIDGKRTYANTSAAYVGRLRKEFSLINAEPAVVTGTSFLHMDLLTSISGILADRNWQVHYAVPGAAGDHLYGVAAGIFDAVNWLYKDAIARKVPQNSVIAIPSAMDYVESRADANVDEYAASRDIVIVRSSSNVNQKNDEASVNSAQSISVGSSVKGIVRGTVGQNGPDVVVPLDSDLPASANGGKVPKIFNGAAGTLIYTAPENVSNSYSTVVVAQLLGTIREVCPTASAQEIINTACAAATKLPPLVGNTVSTRNNFVKCGTFNPTSTLLQVVLKNCSDNITKKWTPLVIGLRWNNTSVSNAVFEAISAVCVNAGGYVKTEAGNIGSCVKLVDQSVNIPITIYQTQALGYYGYSAYPTGKFARFF
jgi:hypothetical protein